MNIHFLDAQVEKFIHSLDEETIAKVLRIIDLPTFNLQVQPVDKIF